MPIAKQLVGQTWGRLKVVSRSGSRGGRATWRCVCVCGKECEAVSHALTSGHTKSCGCLDEDRKKSEVMHGHARRGAPLSSTYRTWQAMLTRCYNPNTKAWNDYGGRGIKVCAGWHYFENFLAYMGERPVGMTIERNDSNGDYEPNNCRWATRAEQSRNTRRTSWVEFGGKKVTQAEFATQIGLKQSTVNYRLRKGWSPQQIANTPPYTGNRVTGKLGETVEVPEEPS